MPKAWFCIPSARPVAEVLPVVAKWREMGYGICLQRDLITSAENPLPEESVLRADSEALGRPDILWRTYRGYAEAVNTLAKFVLDRHPEVDWIVTGGDDTFPDPNKTG